jgi:cytochrome c-type biogenesis protein CcmH
MRGRPGLLTAALLAGLLASGPAPAISPDELLDDPALEARARDITRELRCVVCQSESIDESNAEIARDLRLLVRERVVAGDSNDEVIAFVVDRYGEFVLFRPPFTPANAPLWLAGPVFLILGCGLAFAFIRRRARAGEPAVRRPLSPEEERRLAGLMKD